jgi:hypothetical protein
MGTGFPFMVNVAEAETRYLGSVLAASVAGLIAIVFRSAETVFEV